MKKRKITYTKDFLSSPATYWVHFEQEAFDGFKDTQFKPPIPSPIKGLGYARFWVEYHDLKLVFASLAELQHTIEILSQKNLPTTTSLSKKRNAQSPKMVSFNPERNQWTVGPNKHWLSRLPSECKSWKFRQGLVDYLRISLKEFIKKTAQV